MPLQITEILGPSDQGKARPYLCRADDGSMYYVKGRQTNRASLWNEWICGHLARALGLNVPAFSIVDISAELLAETPPEWKDIGLGPAFGSRRQPHALWLEPSLACMVPLPVQRDVLMFDWWVRNGDRLTGNTNLLWDASAKKLVVIDHNLAFDTDFSAAIFAVHHVFASQWPIICGDLVMQAEYAERLAMALEQFALACGTVPEEWRWANVEQDVPAKLDLEFVRQTLARCETPELWRTV